MNILLGDLSVEKDTKDILDKKLGMRVYLKLLLRMELEFPNPQTKLSEVQCCQISTFINLLGHVMERHTVRLTTFLYTGDGFQLYCCLIFQWSRM
jgi:hypothetical protein